MATQASFLSSQKENYMATAR